MMFTVKHCYKTERRVLMENETRTQFLKAIFQLKKLWYAGYGTDSIQASNGFSIVEIFLLNKISNNTIESPNNVSMKEIREHLFATKAAVSQVLNVLEKKGCITRDIDKNNRRNVIVTLTDEGRAVLKTNMDNFNANIDKFITYLGIENTKQVIELTEKMLNAVELLKNDWNNENNNEPRGAVKC
jgi:DNA-binding MarR family transcriptional regulator